jgi:uncharacterized coiled-coil DUF342 family protein
VIGKRTRSHSKTGEVRERELRMAIVRIQRGRSSVPNAKVTFAAVAREVGVSTALIHNCHPKIAELIRQMQGRSSRARRDAMRQELLDERRKCSELRAEMQSLRAKLAAIVSINEVILSENRVLKATGESKVRRLSPTGSS